ncbi:MAG: energy transducer TonB [Cytophagales bacterium]|nr:energy transducer TonB [Cytophagales bacterium]MDW8384784.1 energy transducer TonB [Flammeovirgaceae bacterium]
MVIYKALALLGYGGIIALFLALIVAMVFLFRYIIEKKSNEYLQAKVKDQSNFTPLEKKFYEVDVDKYSGLLSNVGLTLSLALVLAAFEMPQFEEKKIDVFITMDAAPEEVIDVPITQAPPPPPPQMIQPVIVEVPDEQEIKKDVQVEFKEPEQETAVTVYEGPTGPPGDGPVGPPAPVIIEEDVNEIFTIVEENASPPGGMQAFYEYLAQNIKYPKSARKMGIEGKVFVQFVVERDGSLTDIQVMRSLHPDCDAEAVRVLKEAPKWKPGKQRGRPVRQKMTIPINFKLN